MNDLLVLFSTYVIQHQYVVGPVVSVAIFGSFVLTALISDTKHARSQIPPVRAVPFMPQHHFRQWGYIFSGSTWKEVGGFSKALLLLTRLLLCLAVLGVLTLFTAYVTVDLASTPS